MIDWTGIAAVIAPITTLTSGMVGYWLAGRNDEARDKRAADREAAARRAALAERLEEDRHAFQRDTLLELQDKLLDLSRVTNLINLHDQKTVKEQQQLTQLPDDLGGEKPRELVANIQRLRNRVLDPALRQEIQDFVAACMAQPKAVKGDFWATIRELQAQDADVAMRYERLVDHLGEKLRTELDRRFLVTEPGQDALDAAR